MPPTALLVVPFGQPVLFHPPDQLINPVLPEERLLVENEERHPCMSCQIAFLHLVIARHQCVVRHSQSKFVYFAKTSEPDFAAIDFPAFFRVDLSGSMAAPSI
jgi:hypothetical protein